MPRKFDGKRYWRVPVHFGKPEARARANRERAKGHKARVVKGEGGDWYVFVNYKPYN